MRNFSPMLSSLLRENSRTVCFLASSRKALSSASATNGSAEYRWSSQGRFRKEEKTWCLDIQLEMRSQKSNQKSKSQLVLILHRMLLLWTKEETMVDSSDEFKSSRSIHGKDFPNEILNAKIVSAVKEHPEIPIQQENHLRRTQKPKKEDRFLWRRQIEFIVYENFRVIGAHDTVLDFADFNSITLLGGNIQEFDARSDDVLH